MYGGRQGRLKGSSFLSSPLHSFEPGSLSLGLKLVRSQQESSDHLISASTPRPQCWGVPLLPQPQLEHRPHGTVPHSLVSLLGTSQLAETFKCLCCHTPRASWQCGTQEDPRKGRALTLTIRQPGGKGRGHGKCKNHNIQVHTETWVVGKE